MFQKVRTMLFGLTPRMAPAFIALTVLSCSMQANLEEFVEEGLSLVKVTAASYSQGTVENRSVLSGSEVAVNLEILNPEGLDLEYEIGCDTNYIDGGEIPTIAPTGPGQDSVSFTFKPSGDAENHTIVFTIAIRSVKLNKIVARKNVSIPCVYASNTDIRLEVTLGSARSTYHFSGTGQTTATMDLTTATTVRVLPTAEVFGQKIECRIEANGTSTPTELMSSGTPKDLSLTENYTNILSIMVTSPRGIPSWTYTIKIPRGFTVIPAGEYTVDDFADLVRNENHVKLGGDVKLTGVTNGSVISTGGNSDFYFDGNGHKIKNLRINISSLGANGFIDTNSGVIKNLVLEDVYIINDPAAAGFIGGLVGYNHGTIYNCSVSGTIQGTNNDYGTGGIAGVMDSSGKITECYSTATVSANTAVGGLVGDLQSGTIENCYARGHVSGTGYVGGLVGTLKNAGIVRNSYATDASSGSLWGSNDGSDVDSFYGSPTTSSWNITNTLNPAYVWGIGSGINGGYPYLQYFGAQTQLP